MEIVNVNTRGNKDTILDMINKIKKIDHSEQDVNVWLMLNLGTDTFNAWLAKDKKDKPVGVLTCEIVEQQIEPKVFISFCYVDIKGKKDDVSVVLVKKCEEWAKENGVKKLLYFTKRKSIRAMEKQYGFFLDKAIMVKEIQ